MFAFVRDSLKKDVLFKKADICDDIDNVPKARTVLFCRNFWNYLSSEQQSLLLNKLMTLLDDTCHIIIGEFDKIYGLHELLEKRGFAQTTVKGVMRKTKPF